jgi:hypothetical protein
VKEETNFSLEITASIFRVEVIRVRLLGAYTICFDREDGNSNFVRTTGIHAQYNTVSQPKRPALRPNRPRGVKRQAREADQCLVTSAQVKNARAIHTSSWRAA